MLPFLNLGPLAIPTKPFLILLGIYLALWLVEKTAAQLNFPPDLASDRLTKILIGGFIAARLVFVIEHWDIYARNPIGVIWPITAGFTPWAGFVGGALALVWATVYGSQKKKALWLSLDVLFPCLLIFYIALRLGDLFGGPGFGTQTSLFGLQRHWAQAYDALIALFAFAVWWWAQPQRPWPGWLTLIGTAVLSLGLTLTYPFRGDPQLIGNGWILGQLLMVGVTAVCFALLAYKSEPPIQ